jgi:hypothetical protein
MSPILRALRLLVLPLVAPQDLHPNDTACEGIYDSEVARHWSDAEAYASLLDTFHQAFHPCRPDDFSYQVWDQDRQLQPGPVQTSHVVPLTKQQPRLRVRAYPQVNAS